MLPVTPVELISHPTLITREARLPDLLQDQESVRGSERCFKIRSPCFFGPMNPLPVAALPRTQSSAGSVGNVGNAAPTSTTASPTSVKGKRSRKRESSSGSEQDGYDGSFGDKRRQPGVKRACNECRQQKVGCALVVRRQGEIADESLDSCDAM